MAIYAVSYDPVQTLSRFADAHGIGYPLLSDEGSELITRLGLLNTTIERERAAYGRPMEDRHRGIPYPGTFFLDEHGVVVAKRFERSHRIRPSGRTLLRQLVGTDAIEPAVGAEAATPGVRVAAWLDTDILYANQLQELHVRIELDSGVHLYTEPVPDGFAALQIQIGGDDRVRSRSVTPPRGSEFHVEGLPDTFYVIDGSIEISAPFILLSNRDTAGDESRSVPLTVEIIYQACTKEACFIPEMLRLELPMREEPNPGYETADPVAVSSLALRRIVEQSRTDGELLELINAALSGVAVDADQLACILEDLASGGLIHRDETGRWAMPASPN